MKLRVATQLVGKGYYPESWTDNDLDNLLVARDAANDIEAWDRAHWAERQLEFMISGGDVPTYGENHEGVIHELGTDRTTTPYFRISANRNSFLVFEDMWATIYVDAHALRALIQNRTGALARKRQTFEWLPVANEAWRFALKDQRLPRTQADIIGHVQQWYFDTYNPNKAPHEKELSQLAREVIRHLGDFRLSTEVSPPDRSSD